MVRYLEAHQVAVYGTLVGDSATWGLGYLDKLKIPLLPLSPDNILPKYTADTGGHLYAEFSTNGIQRSFQDLAALARTEYTLGYYSHVPITDGKIQYDRRASAASKPRCHCRKGLLPTATNLSR